MGDTKTHINFCTLAKEVSTVNLHVLYWDANSGDVEQPYCSHGLFPNIHYESQQCPLGVILTYHLIFQLANIYWNTAYCVSGARYINMDNINSLCAKHSKAKELLHLESRKPPLYQSPELRRQKPEQKPLYQWLNQSRWAISFCSNQMTPPQIFISPTSYISTTGQLRAVLCYHHPSLEISASTCGRRRWNSWRSPMDRTLCMALTFKTH